ncbi:hypothetical protein GGH91_003334, partial [Coemansia sp. RSA 2671]
CDFGRPEYTLEAGLPLNEVVEYDFGKYVKLVPMDVSYEYIINGTALMALTDATNSHTKFDNVRSIIIDLSMGDESNTPDGPTCTKNVNDFVHLLHFLFPKAQSCRIENGNTVEFYSTLSSSHYRELISGFLANKAEVAYN